MFKRILSAMLLALFAAVVLASGSFAAWESGEMIAWGTTQKAILTPSWSLDSGVYTYSYELYNTAKSDIDGFQVVLPSYINLAELWDFQPNITNSWWHVNFLSNNTVDWQCEAFVDNARLEVGDTLTFSFKSYHKPDDNMDLWANSSAGWVFGCATYGPGPEIVPEPASCLALLTGLVGLVGIRRKRS
ncbi:MAG: PEP-CTERM sorting domain-containing protein [Armatimonadetes bacterium]|jgi:hypothetical protein|nr:PEP-CTERM sorting domain-containing protein [Armatimonadota bacterium]